MRKEKHLIVTAANGKTVERVDLWSGFGKDGSKLYAINGLTGFTADDLNKKFNELKLFGTKMFDVIVM